MKCSCGKIGQHFEVLSKIKLTLCPECLEEFKYLVVCLKVDQKTYNLPEPVKGIFSESPQLVYNKTTIKGFITKSHLKKIKASYRSDMRFCAAGSQSPPLFEVLWECKSAQDAKKHGFSSHDWYKCVLVGRTLVGLSCCVKDLESITGPEFKPTEKPVKPKKLTKQQKCDLDKILGAL